MADHMTAVEIHCKQEEDFTAQIRWWDDEGCPIPMLGTYAKMEVRDSQNNLVCELQNTPVESNPPTNVTDPIGHLTINMVSGIIQMYIHRNHTRAMPVGVHRFDMYADVPVVGEPTFATDASTPGNVVYVTEQRRAVVAGLFVVHPNVTVND